MHRGIREMETNMESHLTPEKIMQTGMAFFASKTLLSAVELGLFTELAKQPQDLERLKARFGLHDRAARDFLDALVALGFVERTAGTYSNTKEVDLFLDKAKPSYVGGILEMANHRLFGFWNNLTEALKTGAPQNEAKKGGDLIGELYADPARLKEFLRAMTGISHGANMSIARGFTWKDYKTFVDVGTAQGDLAVQIALANPHVKGIGFDLPAVGPICQEYFTHTKTAAQLSFVGGDFFNDELPKADVVLMGHILHDWDLPTKKMLIKKAYDALPAGGSFIAYDTLIDDDRSKNAFGLLMSLNMLIETKGGFDYSGADCTAWLKEAGFRDARVEALGGPDAMVVGIK